MHAQMYLLPAPWEAAIAGWCAWLTVAGRSPRTIRTRRGHVRGTARRLGSKHPNDVTSDQLIAEFATHTWSLDHRRGLRAALQSFYGWATINGYAELNPADELPKVPQPKPAPRPVPDWMWEDTLAAADARELLMVRLAGEAGLRRAEVCQVHTDDVFWDGTGYWLLVKGKGDKQRTVPISDALATEIQRGPGRWSEYASGWLFPGQDNGHLSPGHVGKLISGLMPKGWSMHKLRTRYGTLGYAETKDILAVQETLGHSSPDTTLRYTAVPKPHVRAVADAVAARSRRSHLRAVKTSS